MNWELERDETNAAEIADRDSMTRERMEKSVQRFVGPNGEVRHVTTFRAFLTDGWLATKLSQVGPVCSEDGCQARLHAEHLRTCAYCSRPICQEHSYRFPANSDTFFHKSCRRIAMARAALGWLFSAPEDREDLR